MKQKIKITREQIKQAIRRAYPQAVFPDEDRLTVDFVVKTGWEHYPFHFPDSIEVEVDVPKKHSDEINEDLNNLGAKISERDNPFIYDRITALEKRVEELEGKL